jgi:predicted nucleic acid-binding protein
MSFRMRIWPAIAIQHGLTLCTANRGFARFKDLRWMNPLEQ